MKVIKKDKLLAEKEIFTKKKLEEELENARNYISKMKDNRAFSKYVIDGIIRKNIEELSSINIFEEKKTFNATADEIKSLLLGNIIAKKKLEKIFRELVG